MDKTATDTPCIRLFVVLSTNCGSTAIHGLSEVGNWHRSDHMRPSSHSFCLTLLILGELRDEKQNNVTNY